MKIVVFLSMPTSANTTRGRYRRVLLKLSGQREVNMIMSEFGLGVSKDQLLDLYKQATAEKFQPLLIDLEEEPDKRFRKGLLEVLTPPSE